MGPQSRYGTSVLPTVQSRRGRQFAPFQRQLFSVPVRNGKSVGIYPEVIHKVLGWVVEPAASGNGLPSCADVWRCQALQEVGVGAVAVAVIHRCLESEQGLGIVLSSDGEVIVVTRRQLVFSGADDLLKFRLGSGVILVEQFHFTQRYVLPFCLRARQPIYRREAA